MLIGFSVLWLILCGNVTPEILLFDALITAGVFWFVCRFCYWSVARERTFWRLIIPGLKYIGLLIREIVKANIMILSLALRRQFKAQPLLIRIQVPLRTNIAKMTLANSITLTPGSIAVENAGTEFVIHCFHPIFSTEADTLPFVKALLELEAIALDGKEGA